MRIGVLCNPNSFHTKKWVSALQKAGAEPMVFSFDHCEDPNFPHVQIKPSYCWKGNYTYLSYLFGGRPLRNALKEHQIQVLNPINITPYGVWALRSRYRPIVAVAMGADILEYPPKRHARPFPTERAWKEETKKGFFASLLYQIKWHVFRFWVKKALNASTYITGDNLVLIHSMRDWFGIPAHKLHLNRWGVEPALFETTVEHQAALKLRYGIKEGEKIILSPRGMKPLYQGDIILASFEQLLRQGIPNIRFIMFTAGYEYPEALREKAAQLSQSFDQLIIIDRVLPREEVLGLWPMVDLMISAPVYDGYSNALGEARYAGVIPIVNDTPATRELISHKENGWIVEPFGPKELTAAIIEINKDWESWKQKFAKPNREWIEQNGLLATNIQRFMKLCQSAVEIMREGRNM